MTKKYLTIQEAAEFLNVSSATLRNWDKAGKLTPSRHPINNYRVYRLSQLEDFVSEIKPRPRVKKLNITLLEE